jgi:hypothetical protein
MLPSGLWTPHSTPANKFTAQDVKPENRKFLGGRGQYDFTGLPYGTLDHWRNHARGRIHACIETITKAAVLRSRGGINDSEPIEMTGAVYQDFKGVPEFHQRAHRFPCNPWVGVFTLPELALRTSPAFWREMVNPLAATDIVPNFVNHGDSCIEKAGVYPAVKDAFKEIVQEQNKNKPVNARLIQHVLNFSLLPKLRGSFEQALEGVRQESENDFVKLLQGAMVWSPEGRTAMEQESIHGPVELGKPTKLRECTMDYLTLCIRDANTYQPASLQTPILETEISRVHALGRKEE